MARLYESSTDYQEHITYAGATIADDYDNPDYLYDREQLAYDGGTTNINAGYSSTVLTYSQIGSRYNGFEYYYREGTGLGNGSSATETLRIILRDELSSGIGSETSESHVTRFSAAVGSGQSSQGVVDLYVGIRSATSSGGATTSDSATRFLIAFRQTVSSGNGSQTATFYSYRPRLATGGGLSSSAVQSFATLFRQLTGEAVGSGVGEWRIRKMARYTVNNVIDRVRRQLNSSLRHETNALAAPFNVGDTTLTMAYDLSTSVRQGTILSVGTELMRVLSVEPNSREITVIRGWQDSEAENHPNATEILINPRFTRFDIFDALIDEVASWETEIFRIESYQWTIDSNTDTVELPSSFEGAIGVAEVMRQWSDSESTAWPQMKYRLQRGATSVWDAVSSSGLLIRLVFPQNVSRAGKIHALVAMPFDVGEPLVGSSNLVTVLGMTPSQVDLLVQGIKVRLLADDENIRSSRQAANTSLAINQYNAASNLDHLQVARANYLKRYADEVTKLRARYPIKSW